MTDGIGRDNSDDPQPTIGDDDVTTTDGVRRRWWATNDMLAALLLASLTVLLAAGARGLLTLSAIPAAWTATYLGVCGGAAAWAFGSEAIAAWRDD